MTKFGTSTNTEEVQLFSYMEVPEREMQWVLPLTLQPPEGCHIWHSLYNEPLKTRWLICDTNPYNWCHKWRPPVVLVLKSGFNSKVTLVFFVDILQHRLDTSVWCTQNCGKWKTQLRKEHEETFNSTVLESVAWCQQQEYSSRVFLSVFHLGENVIIHQSSKRYLSCEQCTLQSERCNFLPVGYVTTLFVTLYTILGIRSIL